LVKFFPVAFCARTRLLIPSATPAEVISAEKKEALLASRTELSEFLASVERRAYKQALFAVREAETPST